MMVGFALSREETVRATPIPDFFWRLARDKGTGADRAFFSILKRTYPDTSFPAYYGPQTDYGGCVLFDGNTLTTLYGAWVGFQRLYPERYTRAVTQELAAIEQALSSTCACGGKDGVLRELELFSTEFPDSAIAGQLAPRIASLRSGTAAVRFNCQAR
jgi:hypothetical protein